MDWNPKTIAIAGAVAAFVGMYMPIYKSMEAGSENFFAFPVSESGLFLALLAGSLGLALTGRVVHVLWTGLAATALLVYKCYETNSYLDFLSQRAVGGLSDNVAMVFGEALTQNHLGFGWLFTFAGAGMLVLSGILAKNALKSDDKPVQSDL